MGLEAEKTVDAPARLIAAGRTLLAQGDTAFSLSRLCAEAGVSLADFRASFASKAELMQQLMEPQKVEAPQADPWLERRLRVFERALGALEEKAEKRDRDTRQAIARLEERVAEISGTQLKLDVAAAARAVEAAPVPQDDPVVEETDAPEEPNPLLLAPLEPAPLPRLDTEVLEQARRAAMAHGRRLEHKRASRRRIPTRMLVMATLAILLLLACAALTLVWAANYVPLPSGGAMTVRAMPASPLAQLVMRGDSGDVAAQRALALAYLKGEGVAKDTAAAARWAQVAASGGDAEAQYLLGHLHRGDPADAFAWFTRAASAGHLKAMQALGVAYAQGQGVARDEALAADWFAKAATRGHVDAAFNLAVLYERGHGLAQDPRAALRWYRAAAKAGDRSAAARARLLAQQAGL
jgi:TPR repeat protein